MSSKHDLVPLIFGSASLVRVDMQSLWRLIEGLPDEEAELMRLLFEPSGHRTEMTYAAAARQLGISQGRFRSILDRALRKLRHPARRKEYMYLEVAKQQYSHRNGETEPPTEPGGFWFKGLRKGESLQDRIFVQYSEWYGRFNAYGAFMGPYDEPDALEDDYKGQWWGPIIEIPPWETDAA